MNSMKETIDHLTEIEEDKKKIEESYLKMAAKAAFFHLDVYTNMPLYLWIDNKEKGAKKIKYNMDDTVKNQFFIRKNTEFYLKGIKEITCKYSKVDDLTMDDVYSKQLMTKIKKELTQYWEDLNYKLTGFYMEKSKIIYYINKV